MAGQQDIAVANWERAQKIRTDILKKSPSLKTTRFEEAEGTLAEFRLACMTVIFHDFEYAVEKKVEGSLWQCHTFLNGEYRKASGRLTASSQVVQKRKLDKLHRAFLKTSEQFYFVYIQQLYKRFTIPELEHIARREESLSIETPTDNASPPAPLRSKVLKSCRMTLVRLGDLARYRCQLSDNYSKTAFNTALDYYDLANSLDPDDGSAHHQLAVLHQIPSQHFDIVYHFHRAIAISKPHQLALGNLEREFKSPEDSQARKGSAIDQAQAMVTWFVRLHAFFFHGKHFSQQSELETEVLHRVELTLKNQSCDNTVLLKMILVNMAAYDIATEKVKSSWTMEGSQSCQFLLRFNLRTMLIVLRTLHTTLHDETAATSVSENGSNDGESCVKFARSLLNVLPLFRLYLAWTYVTRADLVQYQEYLEPYIKDLYGLLADVLTSLNLYIGPTMNTMSSMYLLPEDTEAQGLRPLSERRLPLFFRIEEQQSSVPPKRVKAPKPQQTVFGRRFKEETEAVWRIRDIICCGALLAGSAKFPITLTTRNENGVDVETWVYADETKITVSSNEVILSHLLTKLNFGDIKGSPENNAKSETSGSRTQSVAEPSIPVPDNVSGASITQPDDMSSKLETLDRPSKANYESDSGEDSEDSEMVNMVMKLVDPEDDIRPESNHAQTDSSYGMHSSTANEILGHVEAGPVQPSPISKTIPNLPWAFFHKPTPHGANSLEQKQLSPNVYNTPRSVTAQFDGLTSSAYLDNLGAPHNQVLRSSLSRGSNTGYAQNSPIPITSSPSLPRKEYAPDSLEGSRSAVLEDLASALLAQHGLTCNNTSQGGNLTRTNATPVWGQQNGIAEHQHPYPRIQDSNSVTSEYKHSNGNGYMEGPVDHHNITTQSLDPLGPPGHGRPTLGYASSSAGTSRFLATGFATESFEAHHALGQGLPDYPQNSPWPYEAPRTSSHKFPHPSSLITGAPGAVSVAPASGVACNGNFYNATTPFGRLDNGVNNRTNPTHFRNQLKVAIGTSELPYDQQILQGAMMDNNRNRRP
ncbi:hypothetical protein GGR50DRAFT_363392 [Xylaria sp. CBS 124048]|nr:hypothetical protein GGR50DRAFT_363392 [Xylaria sp. CBS 124048]